MVRPWTDLSGNQTRATFVRMNNGNVILMCGGRVLAMPFYSLSVIDREYVRELLVSRGEERLIPDRPDERGQHCRRPADRGFAAARSNTRCTLSTRFASGDATASRRQSRSVDGPGTACAKEMQQHAQKPPVSE